MYKKKIGLKKSDFIVGAIFLIVGVVIYYRLEIAINYKWNWGKIPQFLYRFDEESGKWVSNVLMWGLFNTIRLSIFGTILAIILGTIMGICRSSKVVFLRLISGTYVETMRNLPPLVIIFIVYFFIGTHLLPYSGIGDVLEGRDNLLVTLVTFCLAPPEHLTTFLSALFTLAIFEGAYITEIVRAGIQSIRRGQWEAAHSLGMTKYQQMRYIILPQAFQRILPPLAGQFISLIKDSSIVSVISIPELSFRANELMTGTLLTMEIWITVTIMYLMLTLPCSLAIQNLEDRLARG
ncbi:MAG: amino acid ABC transporter permease [Desulfosarcina sp.]|nr:amino acid ABC transporter permease [Desulfosarcina sp.]MBC2744230.1 amino acid ABC transporter permease [Desulfosarcina sp.]MBC2767139.1 amino acid ABC transporter permease [Desulfosarcina sp.]